MKYLKLIGAIVVLLAIGMFAGSFYIQSQIDAGAEQISSAKKKIKTSEGIFSLNPVTKDIGTGISKAAQKKILSSEEEIAYYQGVANQLFVAGIIGVVLGGLLIVVGVRSKR